MIEFKNRLTGTLMAVAPEREAEYLAAGHTRVDAPAAVPARQTAEEPPHFLRHCEALPTVMPWQSPGRESLL